MHTQTPERFEELDALRGLAAMAVFVYHCIFLLAVIPTWLVRLIHSPLGLVIYGGHQAVILFFVLSGFVLFLPYTRPGYHAVYPAFVVKRICRIYLPYLAALVFFVAVYVLFFKAHQPDGLSDLYQWRALSLAQGMTLFRQHLLFVGFFHREYWNGATWTLAEEMRISFIYPFLALMVVRLRAKTSLLLALTCSAAVSVVIHRVHHRTPFEPFHYASLFVLGAVLASNRKRLLGVWRRSNRVTQSLVVCVAILGASYAVQWSMSYPALVTEEASDWIIALSVAVFLLAALAGTWFSRLLNRGFMQHLGRTSYGIYLLHLPVLFAFANLLWNRVPAPVVFGLALAVTLALAHVFYVYVEQPAIALGKRAALNFRSQPASASTASDESVPSMQPSNAMTSL